MRSEQELGQAKANGLTPAAARPTLSLTFDDGPDRVWTARVMDQLRRYDVAATFFVIGSRVAATPDVTEAVIENGHQVELHCHDHVRHTELTEAELDSDTELALDVFAGLGLRPTLWRPPWGIITDATLRVARRHDLSLRRWEIDSHDWRGDRPEAMLSDAQPQLARGGSVLMHDALGPGALRTGCANTVGLLPRLIDSAHSLNLAITPMTAESST